MADQLPQVTHPTVVPANMPTIFSDDDYDDDNLTFRTRVAQFPCNLARRLNKKNIQTSCWKKKHTQNNTCTAVNCESGNGTTDSGIASGIRYNLQTKKLHQGKCPLYKMSVGS